MRPGLLVTSKPRYRSEDGHNADPFRFGEHNRRYCSVVDSCVADSFLLHPGSDEPTYLARLGRIRNGGVHQRLAIWDMHDRFACTPIVLRGISRADEARGR